MRSFVLAACAGIVVGLSVTATAAPPDAAPHNTAPVEEEAAAGEAKITFDEYRNWRLAAMERRRSEIEIQLSAADLPAARKARLEETRAYYKWLANLPAAERDKRFRERFDQIDTNHDGVIDAGERGAWRERQRAFYGGAGRGGSRQPASAPTPDGKKDAAAPPASAR